LVICSRVVQCNTVRRLAICIIDTVDGRDSNEVVLYGGRHRL